MDWIKENLDTFDDWLDGLTIDWGTGVYTPADDFYEEFKDVIDGAVENDDDVRKAIADNAGSTGYDKLILN